MLPNILSKVKNVPKFSPFNKYQLINRSQQCFIRTDTLRTTQQRPMSSIYVQGGHSYAYAKSNSELSYGTLGQALNERALSNPKDLAVISHHEQILKSYNELDIDVSRLANAIKSGTELQKCDVVGLWSANSYNSLLIQYACSRLGLIVCTINPAYKSVELEYVLQKAKVRALFLLGQGSQQEIVNKFVDRLSESKIDHDLLKRVILIDGDTGNIPSGLEVLRVSDILKSGDSTFDVNNYDLLTADDPAIIMFTSGTTGKPKGAVLSHSNLLNNAQLTAQRLNVASGPRLACIPVPLFHIFGTVYGTVMMTKVGLPIVLSGYRYKTDVVVDVLNEHKCTHIMMVPAMTVDILNHIEKTNVQIPSLRGIITGSAPTPIEVAKKFLKAAPSVKSFSIRYGSTETGGCMSMPVVDDGPDHTIDNVGAPLHLTEMKVVNPKTGQLLKIGEQGELWARGHNVMLGYWEDEVKTKEAIENGWFKTGDMATMNNEGYIKLVGRTKELIIGGGENVYPKEIEELLHQHSSVYEAFVCGVPDDRMGEEICAWIKLKEGVNAVSEDEIKGFCMDKISYYKVPRYILFVDDFPRTPTGKAQKFAMTEKSIDNCSEM